MTNKHPVIRFFSFIFLLFMVAEAPVYAVEKSPELYRAQLTHTYDKADNNATPDTVSKKIDLHRVEKPNVGSDLIADVPCGRPDGSILDGNGNPLAPCAPNNNGGIDFAKHALNIYDGAKGVVGVTVDIVKCAGAIVGTGAICTADGAAIVSCFAGGSGAEGTDDEGSILEVCNEDEFGAVSCSDQVVPTWLLSCGLAVPLTAICIKIAKETKDLCT